MSKEERLEGASVWEDVWGEECPCCSGRQLNQCCGPKLRYGEVAKTAEELMRSRYSAFALEEVDYIMETHDPTTRHEVDREEIASWSEHSDWTGLSVVGVERGSESDSQGKVEFVAHYLSEEKEQSHHELADFVKKDGRWYFTDGAMVRSTYRRESPKIGRNDPCFCGSGKKFKKCCG